MTARRGFAAVVAVAVAAEALLAPAWAAMGGSGTPAMDPTLSYARLPVSTLVSSRDLEFQWARSVRAGVRTTVLAYRSPEGKLTPVAAISSSTGEGEARVAIQRWSVAGLAVDARVLHVAVLEHLYGLAMREDPQGRFCLAEGGGPCDPGRASRTHTELLRELAAARRQALVDAGGAVTGSPWFSVSLLPAAVRSANPDQVSARVALGQQPVSDTRVFFNRAPHSSCSAMSDAGGVATCVLVDQHGDDDDDTGQAAVPVLVTFPGIVAADRVLLPTTTILQVKQ